MQARSFRTVTPVLPVCELKNGSYADKLAATIPGLPEDGSRVASGGDAVGWTGLVTREPTAPRGQVPDESEQTTGATDTSGEPIATLRGAGVDVDRRRVGRVIGGLCLVALAFAVVILFVAGFQKNTQITRLRQRGVPVEVTVTGCLGLMGGSGSNLVGYQCSGTLTVEGHRYNEAIPGSTFRSPGSTLRAVTVPGDPALLSTTGALATEHASWRVFVLPTILLLILAFFVVAMTLTRRHRLLVSPQGEPVTVT
jgi:hypothetical protein